MPEMHENNNSSASPEQGFLSDAGLGELLSSEEWAGYFEDLARTLKIELSVFDEDGSVLLQTGENPFCRIVRSADPERCPASCNAFLESSEPSLFRCHSRLMNFSFPVERFDEKVYIVGRGLFAEYEDFVLFIEFARRHGIRDIPVSEPLNFPGESYMRSLSRYVELTISRLLNIFQGRMQLEEKLMRMTSLFDSKTFGTLSKNLQLMYRYILDTIEFVFGETSSSLLVRNEKDSVFRTVCSSGRLKEAAATFTIPDYDALIHQMRVTRSSVLARDLDKRTESVPLREAASAHYFPIFFNDTIEFIIVVFGRQFSREDMKVMNAFKDYIQLNIENLSLRDAVRQTRKSNDKLARLKEFSGAISSVLEKQLLFKTLLDNVLHLLSAEQGSLLLLDESASEFIVEAHKSVNPELKDKMRISKTAGIAGKVLESGDSLLVEDIETDSRLQRENRSHYRTKSFISALINIQGRVTGVLNIADKAEGKAFTEDDMNLVRAIIDSSAVAIERSILYDQTEELRKLSITDPLTGIYNRRYLNRRLSEEITRYNRYKHPFSFMMLDLDKFKEYNDTFGHIAGDNLLKTLAGRMEKSLRSIDIAARFGGDEFVAIFPQTPKVDAIQITNRLKEKIDSVIGEQNVEMPLSVSMGLATYPDDASSIMELIEKTDQALYLAKKGGGNRVVYL